MSYQDDEELDSQNQPTEEVVNTEVVETTDAEPEVEDTQPEYTEAEKKAYARAKKAEAELKALKAQLKPAPKEPVPTPSGLGSLSPVQLARDSKAIADLVDEDVDYVATYADKFGVTLSEARKNKDVQAVLRVRAEERRTAEATSTGNARRGTSKMSDDSLMAKAEAGDIPTDTDSLMRIAQARLKKMKQ
jgi:hypothetical protein